MKIHIKNNSFSIIWTYPTPYSSYSSPYYSSLYPISYSTIILTTAPTTAHTTAALYITKKLETYE